MNYNAAIQRLEIPPRMRSLPIDARGYPVPKFVRYIDGVPDFRVIDADFMRRAIRNRLCWICGQRLGVFLAVCSGPMCVLSGTVSEPGQHISCARFAVQACPFMTHPNRARNEHGLPEDKMAPGIMIKRNPGVAAIYVTKTLKLFRPPIGEGILFRLGEPVSCEWWAHGRPATRDEVMAAINSGLPLLREAAQQDGPEGMAELEAQITQRLALVPA
jgi:hypothetical protein